MRDRVLSGVKAAETNQSKFDGYYSTIGRVGGAIGGKAKGIVKGVAALTKERRKEISNRGIEARTNQPTRRDYRVIVLTIQSEPIPGRQMMFKTRDEARIYKRLLKSSNYNARIFRHDYIDEFPICTTEIF